jgi:hypothetical protein
MLAYLRLTCYSVPDVGIANTGSLTLTIGVLCKYSWYIWSRARVWCYAVHSAWEQSA